MDVLHTWLEGTHVGVFTRAADGHIGFDYDSPEGPVISLSLPRDGNWTKHAPQFFLDNLLPDNPAVRLWMQRVMGAASEQPCDLLAETGHDVAGGLIFAQALGRRPHDKYNIQANEIIALLRRATGNDDLAYQFIERLAFNTAIGNADAHAKNYSIMLRPSGIALAPVYDVLPIIYWNYVDDHLAMHIDGAKRNAEVTPAHWRKLARQTGLDEEQVQEIATTLAHKARNQAPRAYNDLPSDTAAELQQIIEHSTAGLIHAA